MTTTTVPTNGFIAPPAGGVPTLAVPAPGVVPPLGDPPILNGKPVPFAGQTPGFVQQQAAPTQQTPPTQPVADVAGLVSQLQTLLDKDKPPANPLTKEAPATEKPNWLKESANTFDVSKLDDPILQSMGTMLQAVGKDLDLDRVLGKALAYNDPALVDVAYLAEKGGPAAQQIADMAKAIVQQVSAKATAVTNEVYALAGGEVQWNAAVAAFNAKAPQEVKLVVMQMLDSTRSDYIKAGAKLVTEFSRTSGLFPQQGSPLLNSAGGNPAAAQGISGQDFKSALASLNPHAADFLEKKEDLYRRRIAGKATGL